MFTNRDEVLEKALRIFAKMNYEKASQMEIAKTCGLSKAGLVYYFPFKLDLFKAVVDKYVFDTQHSKNKFNFTANSLSEFIDQYVAGVENTMQRLVQVLSSPPLKSPDLPLIRWDGRRKSPYLSRTVYHDMIPFSLSGLLPKRHPTAPEECLRFECDFLQET